MSLSSSDIKFYAAANRVEADTGSVGGAIDTDTLVTFDQPSTAKAWEVVSSSSSDTTQKVTVRARRANGVLVSDQVTLNGTTKVSLTDLSDGTKHPRWFVDAVLDNDAAGSVTIRETSGNDIAVIPAGKEGVTSLFIGAASDPDAAVTRYEKIFAKNESSTTALLSAKVSEESDPSSKLTFAIEDAKDDNGTATNRKTKPTGITSDDFSGTEKSIPGTDLEEGEAIGIWVALALSANNAALDSSYTLKIAGSSAP